MRIELVELEIRIRKNFQHVLIISLRFERSVYSKKHTKLKVLLRAFQIILYPINVLKCNSRSCCTIHFSLKATSECLLLRCVICIPGSRIAGQLSSTGYSLEHVASYRRVGHLTIPIITMPIGIAIHDKQDMEAYCMNPCVRELFFLVHCLRE